MTSNFRFCDSREAVESSESILSGELLLSSPVRSSALSLLLGPVQQSDSNLGWDFSDSTIGDGRGKSVCRHSGRLNVV